MPVSIKDRIAKSSSTRTKVSSGVKIVRPYFNMKKTNHLTNIIENREKVYIVVLSDFNNEDEFRVNYKVGEYPDKEYCPGDAEGCYRCNRHIDPCCVDGAYRSPEYGMLVYDNGFSGDDGIRIWTASEAVIRKIGSAADEPGVDLLDSVFKVTREPARGDTPGPYIIQRVSEATNEQYISESQYESIQKTWPEAGANRITIHSFFDDAKYNTKEEGNAKEEATEPVEEAKPKRRAAKSNTSL